MSLLNGVDSDVHLLFEIAADASVSQEGIEIPATSAGLETTLDVIAYQIKVALLDIASPWSGLWNNLVANVRRVETLRGADFLKTGNRFAARQIDMTLRLLFDPIPGAPVDHCWFDIVAALAADPEFDDVATMLNTIIAGPPCRSGAAPSSPSATPRQTPRTSATARSAAGRPTTSCR